ncbi:hypothetical protein QN374_12930, partial [Herbaspirillum sp. RTI4]
IIFKSYRFIKTTDSPSEELMKMSPAIIIWLCIIFYGSIFFINDTDCKNYKYNETLNGGRKEFKGKKYLINICGSGVSDNDLFGSSMDRVQMTVLNEQEEVLAKRNYKIFWDGGPGLDPIEISQDSIRYRDDSDPDGEPRTLTMPPSKLDWIAARFPIFNLLIYP